MMQLRNHINKNNTRYNSIKNNNIPDSDINTNNDEAAHIMHLWEPLHFSIKKHYKYINNNPLFLFFSDLLYLIAFPILWIIDSVFLGFKIYNIHNLSKINGAKITISNHVHPMDCTMIGLTNFPHKTYFLSLLSNFNIPVVNIIIRLLNAIPIPNTFVNKKNFVKSINNALKNKKTIHIYPEGSLWPYYTDLRNFKNGAFKFAVSNNVPIVPMVFKFEDCNNSLKLLKKKPRISLYVLKPIYPDTNLSNENAVQKLKNLAYTEMNNKLKNK